MYLLRPLCVSAFFLINQGWISKDLFVSLHEKGYISDEEFEKIGLNINK